MSDAFRPQDTHPSGPRSTPPTSLSPESEEPEEQLLGPDVANWLAQQGIVARCQLLDEHGNELPEERRHELLQQAQAYHARAASHHDLSEVGALTASLTHEVRNILAGVLGLSQLRARSGPDSQIFETIAVEITRGTELLTNFLSVARSAQARPQLTTLADILDPIEMLTMAEAKQNLCKVAFVGSEDPHPFVADSNKAKQVLLNLVLNALQATGPRGSLTIEGRLDGDWAVFSVDDNGPGVPEAQREQVFEAFFSTKGNSGGTGLGLSKALSIVQNLGGDLWVEESHLGGARFIMRLPVQPPPMDKKGARR